VVDATMSRSAISSLSRPEGDEGDRLALAVGQLVE
jgi:hypothetical protein